MLRIHAVETEPFHELPYWGAAPGRGGRRLEALPMYRATIHGLPAGLEALVAASDLQGRERSSDLARPPRLLGEAVAEELAALCDRGDLPRRDRIGIITAGDLYARPHSDRRGGLGCCMSVWLAFARQKFKWVLGAPGNHDMLGGSRARIQAFMQVPNVHFLNGRTTIVDQLRVAGIGGVIEGKQRPYRWNVDEYLDRLIDLLADGPDLVVMHEGPGDGSVDFPGHPAVSAAYSLADPVLVIRGHKRWKVPLLSLGAVQVLNVDHRVVVMTRP